MPLLTEAALTSAWLARVKFQTVVSSSSSLQFILRSSRFPVPASPTPWQRYCFYPIPRRPHLAKARQPNESTSISVRHYDQNEPWRYGICVWYSSVPFGYSSSQISAPSSPANARCMLQKACDIALLLSPGKRSQARNI